MPGPDLRELVGDIREAVERFPRDALVEILTYVFKEYVVQGPAPLAAVSAPLHDGLEGMSFAEVIRSLQLRLDLPELELFDVQGDIVFVRVGGRPIQIEAQAARPSPMQAPPPLAPPSPPVPAATTAAPRPASVSPASPASPGVSFTRTEQTIHAQAPRASADTREAGPAATEPRTASPTAPAEARPAAATKTGAAAASTATGNRSSEAGTEPRKGLLEID